MKKFKFRFQAILDLHEKDLEKAELEVYAAQKKVLDAKNVLVAMKEELSQKTNHLTTVMSSGIVDILTITQYQNYLSSLRKRIAKQHEAIKQCETELEETRQKMLLIRQKKMMMDKIKEKDYKDYLKELEYIDNRNIDEIATVRFTRNNQ